MLVLPLLAACSGAPRIEATVTPQFHSHDRVAILGKLPREIDDLFVPLYMRHFPAQTLVERRDVDAVLGEQEVMPERLDEATRARLRRILGVKAVILPTLSPNHFAVKVIDTETGAISAAVYIDRKPEAPSRRSGAALLRAAVKAMHERAQRI